MEPLPRRTTAFLRWFCPPRLLEGIEGDLSEQFESDFAQYGLKRARRRYLWHVILFFRPEILLRNSFTHSYSTMIYANYLLVSFRNLSRRKLYMFINAFGLSIAMAFSILIFLFLQDEARFDTFHTQIDKLYRIDANSYDNWNENLDSTFTQSAYIQQAVGVVIKDECPSVKYVTRFNTGGGQVVKAGDKSFTESITFVDRDFFSMFSFNLLEGNAATLFEKKNEVVITPQIAQKYFGTEDAIGKTLIIELERAEEYEVTGIIESAPSYSTLEFQLLVPQTARHWYKQMEMQWGNFSTPTFVQLEANATHAQLEQQLKSLEVKYMTDYLKQEREMLKLPATMEIFQYRAEPMKAIHLLSDAPLNKTSDPTYSFILAGIAILILIIACINYISLSLTNSVSRRIEVGIRKTIGAYNNQVVVQFLFESILLAFISLIIAFGLVVVFLPAFNSFTDKSISPGNDDLLLILGIGVALAGFTGLIAGSYPAIYLSRFKPALVLKGNLVSKIRSGFTRPLVVVQFVFSAGLMVASLIMYKQMHFIATKELGFDRSNVMVVQLRSSMQTDKTTMVEKLRTALTTFPEVTAISGTTTSFSHGWSRYGYKIDGQQHASYVYGVDPYYIPTIGLQLVEGRNFNPDLPSDSAAVIVNEALVREMGWKNATDSYLNWREDSVTLGHKVIGVVKDYHFLSLEQKIEPVLLTLDKDAAGPPDEVLIKTTSTDLPAFISRVESTWKKLFEDRPFNYSFLDKDVESQYASHNRWMKISGLATGFALVIAALGMFGLSGINALNRTKEVGIRKVMGANSGSIYLLLNREYLILMGIAFLIGTPISWYGMQHWWLPGFQYRTVLGWDIIVLTLAGGVLITLLTVSYHAFKAMKVNPAETLKYE